MGIQEINSEELRRYIGNHDEKDYVLVDVRQPGEYEEGHIPGARLLPLPELARRMDTLPPNQDLVFYCRSGARSMAASVMADEEFGGGTIYNLTGGMLSWSGAVAERPPQICLFDKQATPEQLYRTAMNLEKGAMNFYTTVDIRYGGEAWSDVFGRLAEAEIGHALAVFRLWQKAKGEGKEDFDVVFAGLSGTVLEGGMTLAEALEKAAAGGHTCLHLLELALQVEYSAFDLYRAMAETAEHPEARAVFMKIAQAEKSHMGILIEALAGCPA